MGLAEAMKKSTATSLLSRSSFIHPVSATLPRLSSLNGLLRKTRRIFFFAASYFVLYEKTHGASSIASSELTAPSIRLRHMESRSNCDMGDWFFILFGCDLNITGVKIK